MGIRDGHYSKEAEPTHLQKKRNLYFRLTVTNNYDNGKPPATRTKKVVVNEIDTDSYKKYCIYRRTKWAIQKNRDPIPSKKL
jgi:hypothetical protein